MKINMTRRAFLGTASAGVMAASAIGQRAPGATGGSAMPSAIFTKTRVLRIYLGSGAGWPNPHVDADDEMKRLQQEIDKVPGQEDIEFVGNLRVADPGKLGRLLAQYSNVDGVLAIQLSNRTSLLVAVLANAGIPTIIFAIPYSGHEWSIIPTIQNMRKKIDTILSSDFNDVTKAIRPFRAIHRLKETKILYVGGDRPVSDKFITEVKNKFGTEIKRFDHKLLVGAYETVDPTAANTEADLWIKNAEKIKEPSPAEIVKAARMYLAIKRILADEKAQAITINCLGLFDANQLPAYPCLGFCRLNDSGLVGVCESDMASTLTQVIYQHMEGVPGFVTDPVFDTSNNTVTHAHCVAATKMDGPTGPSAPYIIRSHHENDQGASLQVKMRIGQEITMAKIVAALSPAQEMPVLAATPISSVGADVMLVSTGTIIDVPDVDRGCRTKITTKVRDARRMFEAWYHGLHRVIFYGNHIEDTRRLGRMVGFDVIEEG